MNSNESQPLLQDDNLEGRRSGMRQTNHGIAVDVSYDSSMRKQTRRFLSSIYGHYAVLLLVSMDVGCIFADFLISLYICDQACGKGDSVGDGLPKAQDALGIVGLVFSCLFMVELLASVWAFGFRCVSYLQGGWIDANGRLVSSNPNSIASMLQSLLQASSLTFVCTFRSKPFKFDHDFRTREPISD